MKEEDQKDADESNGEKINVEKNDEIKNAEDIIDGNGGITPKQTNDDDVNKNKQHRYIRTRGEGGHHNKRRRKSPPTYNGPIYNGAPMNHPPIYDRAPTNHPPPIYDQTPPPRRGAKRMNNGDSTNKAVPSPPRGATRAGRFDKRERMRGRGRGRGRGRHYNMNRKSGACNNRGGYNKRGGMGGYDQRRNTRGGRYRTYGTGGRGQYQQRRRSTRRGRPLFLTKIIVLRGGILNFNV